MLVDQAQHGMEEIIDLQVLDTLVTIIQDKTILMDILEHMGLDMAMDMDIQDTMVN